jgi:ribonucleotide reductase beta subunit family protein with ferritin-like domain
LLRPLPHQKHNNIWRIYKKAEASFWTAEEIDLLSNAVDWDRLSTMEQHFILHVLAFFPASDGIVNKNLSSCSKLPNHGIGGIDIPAKMARLSRS